MSDYKKPAPLLLFYRWAIVVDGEVALVHWPYVPVWFSKQQTMQTACQFLTGSKSDKT